MASGVGKMITIKVMQHNSGVIGQLMKGIIQISRKFIIMNEERRRLRVKILTFSGFSTLILV